MVDWLICLMGKLEDGRCLILAGVASSFFSDASRMRNSMVLAACTYVKALGWYNPLSLRKGGLGLRPMRSLLLLLLSFLSFSAIPQDGRILRIHSSHTSFPDTARQAGHLYNKVLYDAASHYNSDEVRIFIPPGFKPQRKVNMVFWFHGWGNNIDSSVVWNNLYTQFINAGMNAILVLAETAKDAPDSYGGKLENANEFKGLTGDVLAALKREKVIKHITIGKVTLAGHSGAYRVMAHILQKGGVAIAAVLLFDALYGETEKYIEWIKADRHHRFVNIYTNGGGTDKESRTMVKILEEQGIHALAAEETDIRLDVLQKNRLVVMHSLHGHNEVIKQPDNFTLFLRSLK